MKTSALRLCHTASIAVVLLSSNANAQPGTLDPTFTVGTGASDRVMTVSLLPDGKSVIGGFFLNFQGNAVGRIARVNANGSIDLTFASGTGCNSVMMASDVRPDGKVVIGGQFNSYNGTARVRVAQLTTTGAIDPTFNPGVGPNGTVNTLDIAPDGKVVIGGVFTSVSGSSRSRIARLNTTGTLDAGFTVGTGFNADVYTVVVQPDGKVLVGGLFTSYNGTGRNGIARLNTDGTLDTSFDPGSGANSWVGTIALRPDGRMVIGGFFSTVNGIGRSAIAQLLDDGSLDTSFNPGTGCNSWVYVSRLQNDGSVLIGGNFTTYNGTGRNRLARVLDTGALDPTFLPGTAANNWVYSMAVRPEGKLIIGGGFTNYNGSGRARLAQVDLGCDNVLELELNTDGAGAQTSWQIIPVGFTYAACSGSGYANNSTILLNCCLADGCYKLKVADSFGDGMTTGGYILRDGNGKRIIDNRANGAFTFTSAVANDEPFCLPLGAEHLTTYACDREDHLITGTVECTEDPLVSAEWMVGDQTDDGYQFWFFDPNGTYTRRIKRTHALSGGFGPANAIRACRLKLNSMVTLPIPIGTLLNVVVRPLINGTYGEFGSACRFRMLAASPACPQTKLVDVPSNSTYSCGVTRTFGGSDKIYCDPVMGANKYRFRFSRPIDSYTRFIASNVPAQVLNWISFPLVDGKTYSVKVQASFDNGATWCAFGDSCDVSIMNPPSAFIEHRGLMQEATPALYPMPLGSGEQLWLRMPFDPEGSLLPYTLIDAAGRVVGQGQLMPTGEDTPIDLPYLEAGSYYLQLHGGDVPTVLPVIVR